MDTKVLTLLEASTAHVDDISGQYMINRLAAAGSTVVTQPININPGVGAVHNGLGSIEFSGGKITVGTASTFPASYLMVAGQNWNIRFNVRPADQNISALLGDLVNQAGKSTWLVILNRPSVQPISSVELVVTNANSTTTIMSFNIGTKLPINTWSDVILKRTAGVITCSINGVTMPESYTWNFGSTRPSGVGAFTVGRTADTIVAQQIPYAGLLNDLNINMNA